jgi:hypothetical protein
MTPFHILLSSRLSAANKLPAYHATHTRLHCYDLSPALLGSMLEQELADRRRWCAENCGHYVAEPRRTNAEGHPYHVFWFENYTDAVLFKLRWSPVTTPPDEAPGNGGLGLALLSKCRIVFGIHATGTYIMTYLTRPAGSDLKGLPQRPCRKRNSPYSGSIESMIAEPR